MKTNYYYKMVRQGITAKNIQSLLILFAVVVFFGCGVSSYEAKENETQKPEPTIYDFIKNKNYDEVRKIVSINDSLNTIHFYSSYGSISSPLSYSLIKGDSVMIKILLEKTVINDTIELIKQLEGDLKSSLYQLEIYKNYLRFNKDVRFKSTCENRINYWKGKLLKESLVERLLKVISGL